jgi:hypothetical protein
LTVHRAASTPNPGPAQDRGSSLFFRGRFCRSLGAFGEPLISRRRQRARRVRTASHAERRTLSSGKRSAHSLVIHGWMPGARADEGLGTGWVRLSLGRGIGWACAGAGWFAACRVGAGSRESCGSCESCGPCGVSGFCGSCEFCGLCGFCGFCGGTGTSRVGPGVLGPCCAGGVVAALDGLGCTAAGCTLTVLGGVLRARNQTTGSPTASTARPARRGRSEDQAPAGCSDEPGRWLAGRLALLTEGSLPAPPRTCVQVLSLVRCVC